MKDTRQQFIAGFAPSEREYIRRELDQFFSTLPTVAEGFQLRVWRGGQRAGEPKIPPHAKILLARGLMRLDAEQRPPRLFFTEHGVSALRTMMSDRRLIRSSPPMSDASWGLIPYRKQGGGLTRARRGREPARLHNASMR